MPEPIVYPENLRSAAEEIKSHVDTMIKNVVIAGGGIPDAPADDTIYGRQNNNWVEIPENDSSDYTPPPGGIPKTDLAADVQTSLGKADTALQSFSETDPTVPAWAKESTKPTYTPSEIGAATAAQGAKADTALQSEDIPIRIIRKSCTTNGIELWLQGDMRDAVVTAYYRDVFGANASVVVSHAAFEDDVTIYMYGLPYVPNAARFTSITIAYLGKSMSFECTDVPFPTPNKVLTTNADGQIKWSTPNLIMTEQEFALAVANTTIYPDGTTIDIIEE